MVGAPIPLSCPEVGEQMGDRKVGQGGVKPPPLPTTNPANPPGGRSTGLSPETPFRRSADRFQNYREALEQALGWLSRPVVADGTAQTPLIAKQGALLPQSSGPIIVLGDNRQQAPGALPSPTTLGATPLPKTSKAARTVAQALSDQPITVEELIDPKLMITRVNERQTLVKALVDSGFFDLVDGVVTVKPDYRSGVGARRLEQFLNQHATHFGIDDLELQTETVQQAYLALATDRLVRFNRNKPLPLADLSELVGLLTRGGNFADAARVYQQAAQRLTNLLQLETETQPSDEATLAKRRAELGLRTIDLAGQPISREIRITGIRTAIEQYEEASLQMSLEATNGERNRLLQRLQQELATAAKDHHDWPPDFITSMQDDFAEIDQTIAGLTRQLQAVALKRIDIGVKQLLADQPTMGNALALVRVLMLRIELAPERLFTAAEQAEVRRFIQTVLSAATGKQEGAGDDRLVAELLQLELNWNSQPLLARLAAAEQNRSRDPIAELVVGFGLEQHLQLSDERVNQFSLADRELQTISRERDSKDRAQLRVSGESWLALIPTGSGHAAICLAIAQVAIDRGWPELAREALARAEIVRDPRATNLAVSKLEQDRAMSRTAILGMASNGMDEWLVDRLTQRQATFSKITSTERYIHDQSVALLETIRKEMQNEIKRDPSFSLAAGIESIKAKSVQCGTTARWVEDLNQTQTPIVDGKKYTVYRDAMATSPKYVLVLHDGETLDVARLTDAAQGLNLEIVIRGGALSLSMKTAPPIWVTGEGGSIDTWSSSPKNPFPTSVSLRGREGYLLRATCDGNRITDIEELLMTRSDPPPRLDERLLLDPQLRVFQHLPIDRMTAVDEAARAMERVADSNRVVYQNRLDEAWLQFGLELRNRHAYHQAARLVAKLPAGTCAHDGRTADDTLKELTRYDKTFWSSQSTLFPWNWQDATQRKWQLQLYGMAYTLPLEIAIFHGAGLMRNMAQGIVLRSAFSERLIMTCVRGVGRELGEEILEQQIFRLARGIGLAAQIPAYTGLSMARDFVLRGDAGDAREKLVQAAWMYLSIGVAGGLVNRITASCVRGAWATAEQELVRLVKGGMAVEDAVIQVGNRLKLLLAGMKVGAFGLEVIGFSAMHQLGIGLHVLEDSGENFGESLIPGAVNLLAFKLGNLGIPHALPPTSGRPRWRSGNPNLPVARRPRQSANPIIGTTTVDGQPVEIRQGSVEPTAQPINAEDANFSEIPLGATPERQVSPATGRSELLDRQGGGGLVPPAGRSSAVATSPLLLPTVAHIEAPVLTREEILADTERRRLKMTETHERWLRDHLHDGQAISPQQLEELVEFVANAHAEDIRAIERHAANREVYPERPAIMIGADPTRPVLWLLMWRAGPGGQKGEETQIHNHYDSAAYVKVLQGNIFEEFYCKVEDDGSPCAHPFGELKTTDFAESTPVRVRRRVLTQGGAIALPAPWTHKMGYSPSSSDDGNSSDDVSVSLHGYEKLDRMTLFTLEEGGVTGTRLRSDGEWIDDDMMERLKTDPAFLNGCPISIQEGFRRGGRLDDASTPALPPSGADQPTAFTEDGQEKPVSWPRDDKDIRIGALDSEEAVTNNAADVDQRSASNPWVFDQPVSPQEASHVRSVDLIMDVYETNIDDPVAEWLELAAAAAPRASEEMSIWQVGPVKGRTPQQIIDAQLRASTDYAIAIDQFVDRLAAHPNGQLLNSSCKVVLGTVATRQFGRASSGFLMDRLLTVWAEVHLEGNVYVLAGGRCFSAEDFYRQFEAIRLDLPIPWIGQTAQPTDQPLPKTVLTTISPDGKKVAWDTRFLRGRNGRADILPVRWVVEEMEAEHPAVGALANAELGTSQDSELYRAVQGVIGLLPPAGVQSTKSLQSVTELVHEWIGRTVQKGVQNRRWLEGFFYSHPHYRAQFAPDGNLDAVDGDELFDTYRSDMESRWQRLMTYFQQDSSYVDAGLLIRMGLTECLSEARLAHLVLGHRGVPSVIEVGWITTTKGLREKHAWVRVKRRGPNGNQEDCILSDGVLYRKPDEYYAKRNVQLLPALCERWYDVAEDDPTRQAEASVERNAEDAAPLLTNQASSVVRSMDSTAIGEEGRPTDPALHHIPYTNVPLPAWLTAQWGNFAYSVEQATRSGHGAMVGVITYLRTAMTTLPIEQQIHLLSILSAYPNLKCSLTLDRDVANRLGNLEAQQAFWVDVELAALRLLAAIDTPESWGQICLAFNDRHLMRDGHAVFTFAKALFSAYASPANQRAGLELGLGLLGRRQQLEPFYQRNGGQVPNEQQVVQFNDRRTIGSFAVKMMVDAEILSAPDRDLPDSTTFRIDPDFQELLQAQAIQLGLVVNPQQARTGSPAVWLETGLSGGATLVPRFEALVDYLKLVVARADGNAGLHVPLLQLSASREQLTALAEGRLQTELRLVPMDYVADDVLAAHGQIRLGDFLAEQGITLDRLRQAIDRSPHELLANLVAGYGEVVDADTAPVTSNGLVLERARTSGHGTTKPITLDSNKVASSLELAHRSRGNLPRMNPKFAFDKALACGVKLKEAIATRRVDADLLWSTIVELLAFRQIEVVEVDRSVIPRENHFSIGAGNRGRTRMEVLADDPIDLKIISCLEAFCRYKLNGRSSGNGANGNGMNGQANGNANRLTPEELLVTVVDDLLRQIDVENCVQQLRPLSRWGSARLIKELQTEDDPHVSYGLIFQAERALHYCAAGKLDAIEVEVRNDPIAGDCRFDLVLQDGTIVEVKNWPRLSRLQERIDRNNLNATDRDALTVERDRLISGLREQLTRYKKTGRPVQLDWRGRAPQVVVALCAELGVTLHENIDTPRVR